MYGKDWRYAQTRLVGSIVRHGESPVMVHDVGSSGAVVTELGRDDKPFKVKLEELNVKPVSLGFSNAEGEASYICRVPKRRDWRQGVRTNSMKSFGLPPQVVGYAAISKTIRNVYPNYDSCLRRVRERGGSWAWHRHWALTGNSEVLYKCRQVVGSITSGQPVLDEKFQHLQEYLEECL